MMTSSLWILFSKMSLSQSVGFDSPTQSLASINIYIAEFVSPPSTDYVYLAKCLIRCGDNFFSKYSFPAVILRFCRGYSIFMCPFCLTSICLLINYCIFPAVTWFSCKHALYFKPSILLATNFLATHLPAYKMRCRR
jgi:hypothetical protein